ncbi:Acyl transferase domain-containing protein [Rhodococcoides kyotonense]|uniref:Acyl transferase domain-containing protein n=2 Tax=Rhodococcoides kyotonense TaxID=398843 RepID=A0A239MBR4_9NOCA|nr:Acyl transferase domain-containing protein [Rhodococcus kyotonensis]
MGAGLSGRVRNFDAHFLEALTAWGLDTDHLVSVWSASGSDSGVDDAVASQPLLFALNYALGRSVIDHGVRPSFLLGHSVGEVVAAVLADVMSLHDAAAIMSNRIAHIADAPAGIMLAVSASRADVEPFLSEHVSIGAHNAPRQVVLVGTTEPMIAAEARIDDAGFFTRRAKSNLPFHSPVLLESALRAVPDIESRSLRPPTIPIVSGYTGQFLSDEEATSAHYWARQPAAPVYFSDALTTLLDAGPSVFVECGPGRSLSSIARRSKAVTSGATTVVSLLPARSGNDASDLESYRGALASLAAHGKSVQSDYTDARDLADTVVE